METKFNLDKLHEIEIDLGLEKTEIYGLWEDGSISGEDAVRKLLDLSRKIRKTLKNPGYTPEGAYFDSLWARLYYDTEEDTYEIEMGYVYRRRLENLRDSIDIDVLQIGLDSNLADI